MIANSLEAIDGDLRTGIPSQSEILLDPAELVRSQRCLLLESSLGQWIATKWIHAQRTDSQFLLSRDALPEHLSLSHPGRLLAMLPLGRISGVPRQKAAILRDRLVKSQISWPGLPVHSATCLYCVDSHPTGLPKQLYTPTDKTLIAWNGFSAVVDGLLNTIGTGHALGSLITSHTTSISTLIFELFKNTHDHARTSVAGQLIGHSVRALYARYYTADELQEQLPQSFSHRTSGGLNPAQQYALSALHQHSVSAKGQKRGERRISGLLELSVFDTGPGFAARWHGADTNHLDATEEMAFVLSCLAKGQSSLKQLGRGFGLWNVLQQLRMLRGFIRIRTNRVHGYREFLTKRDAALQPSGELSGTPREVLFDWKKAVVTTPSSYPAIAGTLVSILLPTDEQ